MDQTLETKDRLFDNKKITFSCSPIIIQLDLQQLID